MTDNLERRVRKALDAEVEAILNEPSTGQMDRARLARIRQAAQAPGLPKLSVPALPDADAEYRGMAARDGRDGGISPELEQRIRELEDRDDA